MKAVLLAAGHGTRLYPLTQSTPKPLVTVGDRTCLDIALAALATVVDSIVVVTGYLGDKINTHLERHPLQVPVQVVVNPKPEQGNLTSVAAERLDWENVHVGPSDYVPWQNDNKVCFIRMEGKLFGNVPMNLELRLSVEDSPNSAGVAIDAIRCCKLALDRGVSGVLTEPAAYFMKHPPEQYTDDVAYHMLEKFIRRLSDAIPEISLGKTLSAARANEN